MAADRHAVPALVAAAAMLLWPAVWNGYPIVFADTGTYLSQAVHRYAGWDRPVFYSMFLLPLHMTVTLWPVIIVQALLTASLLWLVWRTLVPQAGTAGFLGVVMVLSAGTWLPWVVSEIMPDLFTPLLILVSGLLIEADGASHAAGCDGRPGLLQAPVGPDSPGTTSEAGTWLAVTSQAVLAPQGGSVAPPGRVRTRTRLMLAGVATGCIVMQQSSVPLALGLALFGALRRVSSCGVRLLGAGRAMGCHPLSSRRCVLSWLRSVSLFLPPLAAVMLLSTVNLVAHGRFAVSPFGSLFLLARSLEDGPARDVLRQHCPDTGWRLCAYQDQLPQSSDDFLWRPDSPLYRAGGPKILADEAGMIVRCAVSDEPLRQAQAIAGNAWRQLTMFASGDGLQPWPAQVDHWITEDFPPREAAAYHTARQQSGQLSVPDWMAASHRVLALAGVAGCLAAIVVMRRDTPVRIVLLTVLISLPLSAAITGGLSGPHDRYQSRIMWLPPFLALVATAAVRPR